MTTEEKNKVLGREGMMAKATICERTIDYGHQHWRVDSSGNWMVLMWGWWPDSNDRPSWRWEHVPTKKVPREVKEAVC